ncbi:putative tubby-like protein [Helianthus anomalus]
MAQSTTSNPISVIGSEFTAPYPFDIIVERKSGGNMVITDINNNNTLLKVKACNTTFHYERAIFNADGRIILRLRDKIISQHNRWKAYRGDSRSNKNMIFTTKQPNMFQFKTSLHVFLANKDVCDFKVKGSWSKRKCKIYTGDSASSTIAQDQIKTKLTNVRIEGKSKKWRCHFGNYQQLQITGEKAKSAGDNMVIISNFKITLVE